MGSSCILEDDKIMNKKALALLAIGTTMVLFTGCSDSPTSKEKASNNIEPTGYYQPGRYYLDGQVITEDGNIWSYTQDIISKEPAYNNEPVYAVFSDNGTPDVIEDDIIKGLVLDRETAVYDALEDAFSDAEGFNAERTGNTIKISIEE